MTIISNPSTDPSTDIRGEKLRLGLIFGFLSGVALVLGIWGVDALHLFRVNNPTPWLKLLIGAPLVLLICTPVGWLTARLDHGAAGGLFWLITGIVVVGVAAVTPFQPQSAVVGRLIPEFAGLNIYPFVAGAQSRMVMLMIAAGMMMGVIGFLELMFLDGLIQSSDNLGRGFRLVMGMVLFFGVGLMIDGLINQPLRRPLLALNEAVQRKLEVEAHPELWEGKRVAGVSALRGLGDLIHTSNQLSLGTYDPESMVETTAYMNFDGVWSTCFVIEDTPMFCHLSSERYIRRLECLIESSAAQGCQTRLLPGAAETVAAISIATAGTSPRYGILNQRGSAVIALVEAQPGVQFECVFRERGDVILEGCSPTNGRVFVAVTPQPRATRATSSETPSPGATPASGSATPSAQATPVVGEPPAAADPSAALLPAARADLSALPQLPVYAIDLNIDPSLLRFDGRLRATYSNHEDTTLDELYFRLLPNGGKSYGNGSLEVTEARVDGEIVDTVLSVNDSALRLALPRGLLPGEQVIVDLDFSGSIPQDFGGTAAPEGYGIYNFSDEVLSLSGWFPILAVYDEDGWNLDPVSNIGDSVYSDSALFTVRVCAPADLVVAATGSVIDVQESGAAACTMHIAGPVRDFFLVGSRKFERLSAMAGEVQVNSYYLPGNKSSAQQALEVTAASVEIFNEKFGEYPFVELDVIDAPMRNALGVEFPGIILVADSLYDTPERPEFVIATAHEAAHQWWYSVVGNDIFEEPWLDEALTSFSSTLYYEFVDSPQAARGLWEYWQERYDRLKAEGRDLPVAESLEYFEADPSRSYGTVVYTKGALFFDALRAEIGDKAFFSALQNYYREYKYGIARGVDLLAAFEAAAGRDLGDFFDAWLFSPR